MFRERVAGESKLDALVLAQFAGLLLDKVFGGLLPLRFISFALVGALGVLVHLAVLTVGAEAASGCTFEAAQAIATVVAMVFNFQLNNEITYRDQRLRGPRLWRGLLLFMVVCGFGAVANIGIAKALYETHTNWTHRRRDRRDDRRGLELRRLGDPGLARAVKRRSADALAVAAGRARRADPAAPGRRGDRCRWRRTRPITGSGRARWRPAIRTIRRWSRSGSALGTALAGDRPRSASACSARCRSALASLLLVDAARPPAAGPPRRAARRRAAERDAAVRRRRAC